uniref:Phosphatidylinositol glycan anchor biosynthesis, class G n=1 Tax=Nothobranchius korthausae TaxID=1143690 RepID=A0A1A8GXY9_9TELE
MPYTRHLVDRGSSHSFVAKARPPTVTMPRIKALTTGSIPGFIDVVMNLNSPALLEDNLIWQASTAGKRIIFYGDDTWVRLFPKHFMEDDGTTSFFVSDYTEVDNNVTRHLDRTLKRDDWDVLILHYLGLDHIGHISGPHSSLIQPKLLEMDDVLKKIHSSLVSKEAEGSLPYLLVHGKNTGGDWSLSELDVLLLAGTIGHTLSLAASSFVEEEHQTWYFLLNTLCLAVFQDVCRKYFREQRGFGEEEELFLPSKDSHPSSHHKSEMSSEKWLALATPPFTLVCCRLLRSLNQTGVQWAHLPDVGHWLNSSDHKTVLSLLSAFCLVLIYLLVQRRCSLVSKFALALGLLGVYSYRAAVGNVLFPWQQSTRTTSKGTVEARFVYVFVLGILFTGTKGLLRSQILTTDAKLKSRGLWEIYSGLVLLVSLLFRAHNLPVLCCCLLIQTLMAQFIWKKLHYDAAQTTIMHYWFGQAFFYFQGNSNNIATVDISVGFVGLESYIEAPAIVLTALSTYAGPLLWACHLVCYLSSERERSPVAIGHGCYCLALLRSVPAAAYIVLVTVLRYHLFIWSVFSPKLLYESMHLLLTAGVCLFFITMEQSHSTSKS